MQKQPHEVVSEFHKAFDHPILSSPQIPSADRVKLRLALIEEEFKELKVAIEEKDIIAIADAMSDIQYVLSGAILEFGLGSLFTELFNEVHRSNMSKACATKEAADATQSHYAKDGTESYQQERDGKIFVYRTSDNKTLKSVFYSPADLESILKGGSDGE